MSWPEGCAIFAGFEFVVIVTAYLASAAWYTARNEYDTGRNDV